MSLRVHSIAIIVAFALIGHASAQQPNRPDASIHQLRNVAAVDAAKALNVFAEGKRLAVTVVAEPISNSVAIAGATAAHKQLVEMLANLDKQPAQVLVQMMYLEVPAGFADDIGLGEESETKWVLTPREVRMLTAAIRGSKKQDAIDVLSRPQVQTTDNQTGIVEIGGGVNLATKVTPRVLPNGLLLVRMETKRLNGPGADVKSLQCTEELRDGGTLVMRGLPTKTADGVAREMLVVATVHRVATPAR